LDPEVRALWSKREYESHSKISELGKSAKAAEPIRSIAERYRPVLGDMPEHVAFEHLLAAQHMLTTKPREAIKMLAENVGVDLAELAAQDSVTRSRQAIEADVRATITVDAFAQSATHFEEVAADVLEQCVVIRSNNPQMQPERVLQLAYDRALKINARVSAEREQAENRKREDDVKRRASEAKRMASLNVKSFSAAPARKGTWEETLRAVGEKIAG
jgi:hypothetical protein